MEKEANELHEALIAVADAGRDVSEDAVEVAGAYAINPDLMDALHAAVKRWMVASEAALVAIGEDAKRCPTVVDGCRCSGERNHSGPCSVQS